ncbi:hypothetical protein [Rhizobium leguminosarum]|uniref:hypothetical protein n=1 Tax=Rhizobium leguminosarum TaxID=384 RepID=UPI00102FD706|nr:hypothetical protein [Rhizobium leguminosarum]TAX09682.1 hypothetical protein ELI07_09300 [Rhizobium leguminosarum]TAY12525.1 hypothetical protein ELH96_12565 [Rhizobium leguminosarum]TAZ14398.1 hypothetical protein ELH81_10065 [Rhizobium leguminosarum]
MIPSQIADAQTVLGDEEVALCQRVFDRISSVRRITTDTEREDLAQRVIHSYQHGVKDEGALMRLLI